MDRQHPSTDSGSAPSRRHGAAFTAAAAAAGASVFSGVDASRIAHAAGGDELKAVLIGCGGRGGGAVEDFLKNPNTKLIAVADLFEAKAKAAAGRLKLPESMAFSGFDAYKKAIAVDCNYVIIATPPGFRPIHYDAAVKAGKNVFMEKPCCVDAPGFRMLMETNKLVDEKNLKVGVGLQRRHQASYLSRMKEIHDGKFGDLLILRAYWNDRGVWVRERKPGQSEMEYQCNNWYYFVWLCGDHICEQHVHNLDVANWAKNDHPIEANGMGGRIRRTGKDHGQIYDEHIIEFTYPDKSKLYSQCRHMPGAWTCVAEFFHGTKGSGSCSAEGAGGANPYVQEHADLVDAIRNNKKYNEGVYGATSSMTAVLGRMATYSGQSVKWDDAVAKGPAEMIYQDHDKLTFQSKPPVEPGADGKYPVPLPGLYKPFAK
jgi:myo-inositol 2-dehydrogenase/D-chiro-inositol 1-dehydrogenase